MNDKKVNSDAKIKSNDFWELINEIDDAINKCQKVRELVIKLNEEEYSKVMNIKE